MRLHLFILSLLITLTTSAAFAADPIKILNPPKIDFSRTDGGLPRVPGCQTAIVFRADPARRESDGSPGWTYHHHPDIACWRGRLYVGWDSCERDEDVFPSKELYSTSTDGKHWSAPAELFPQGISTALRMYFFHAPNGRMLAIAGLRTSMAPITEQTKGSLVVREIHRDHTLGPVFILRQTFSRIPNPPPRFDTATDAGFVLACQQLLANHLFLEQEDYGVLLDPPDRMPWHDAHSWKNPPDDVAVFGKAMCFYHRQDGQLVSVGKKGWVTTSSDDGKTWAPPVRPPTLVAGMGKVWGQATPDGHYILLYNPDLIRRWPLVLVTGDDGITFTNMRTIHGQLPPLRYPGKYKEPGAAYIRGISMWSSDNSRPNDPIWLVFSVNKEEIWVARVDEPNS